MATQPTPEELKQGQMTFDQNKAAALASGLSAEEYQADFDTWRAGGTTRTAGAGALGEGQVSPTSMVQMNAATQVGDSAGIGADYRDLSQAEAGRAEGVLAADQPGYDAAGASETIDAEAKIKEGKEYGTGNQATDVASQLTALLDDDSDYIKLARSQAKQAASGYGALGTSMAAGMGQRAAIQEGKDVAMADAETRAKFERAQQAGETNQAQTQTEAIVSGELNQQQSAINERATAIKQSFESAIRGMDQESAQVLQQENNEFNERLQMGLKEIDQQMQSEAIDAATADSIRQQMGNQIQNHQMAVETLLGDPNFMMMDADAIANTFNAMRDGLMGGLRFLSQSADIYNADMEDYFESLSEDFTYEAGEVTTIPPIE